MKDLRQHRFLLRIKNSKEKSFTLQELQLKRRRGEITDTTQIWSTRLQGWLPYNKILSEEMLLGADLSYSKPYSQFMHMAKRSHQFQIRPWVRFWARMIDYNCLGIVYGAIVNRYYMYVSLIFFPFFTMAFIPFLWIPIEAILLWTIGTTPGKWMLNIRVYNKRRKEKHLTFQQTCRRSITVWFFGMGCGIPIIQIIAMIIAKIKLTHTRTTLWDKNNRLNVRYRRIGILRIFIVVIFFFTLILQIIKNFSMWNRGPIWR